MRIIQRGGKERLGDEPVNAGGTRLFLNGAPVIGADNDDQHIITHHAADVPGGFRPVHAGHLPVDKADFIAAAGFMRRFRDIDRFPPAERPAGVQPHSLQQKGGMLAGSVIIIHNQHPERRQTVMFFRCALAQAEGQFHGKCCPFALPASD